MGDLKMIRTPRGLFRYNWPDFDYLQDERWAAKPGAMIELPGNGPAVVVSRERADSPCLVMRPLSSAERIKRALREIVCAILYWLSK